MDSSVTNATSTTGADITVADLRQTMDAINRIRREDDAKLIAAIHHTLTGRPTLEVRLDGRLYLSLRGEASTLVIDRSLSLRAPAVFTTLPSANRKPEIANRK